MVVKMRSCPSALRGNGTTPTVRQERTTFKATLLWSWQEKPRREMRPKR